MVSFGKLAIANNDLPLKFKKREELYQPILDKVNNTIKKYGEDNGYTMIFDTSVGGILHGTESDNLLAALKTKLGI